MLTPDHPGLDAVVHRTALAPSPTGALAAIHVKDLGIHFGGAHVLKGITAHIPRGEITAVIGPTGCGKSTLLRSLNRMNERIPGYRRDGDVVLEGVSIFDSGTDMMALRRRVGMLFQRPNPFPMSIRDNVVAGVRAHRMAPRRRYDEICEALLTEVGLWDAVGTRLRESPFRLSGGQQQLLCLARALALDPEVLLLDEPTSALDPGSVERVEELVRRLTPRRTIVIVTHNLAQARRLADRTMFLLDGRLVEFGATEAMFGNPSQPETYRYVTGRIG